MNVQDRRGSFTAEELRQKYNLDGLTKDRKAIQQAENQITKINNEQNQIIEAIILSLADIEIQSEIMLWFFNATPTLENVPALTWEDNETKDEHIGDLYFDRETGYVYQFQLNDEVYEWVNQTNSSLIQAMAISNAAIDTNDNNRRVFLNSPITPYNNGDWYILENGDLKICQISKNEEEVYEEKDFIIASKYVLGTQAQETNNKIVVMAGQVTTIINSIDLIEQSIEDNKYYVDEEGVKHLISTATSTLKQDVSSIEAEVESIGNILTDFIRNVGMIGNYLRLEETPESNGAINKLSIKGFELMPLYPNMTYPSEYTYLGVLSFYTLIFDTVSTFDNNPHYVYVNSPIPLQKLGSVHDELLIEQNKVKVIQRIDYDFINEQWSVLSTPITHELNDVLLPTFEDNTYIKVLYFDDLIYNAEYIVKNDLTSTFATQLESSSQFKINQDEIEAKVNKDGIISSINLSPEEIKILAKKIKLEGLVTANENFKILLDGSIEANKGTFKGDIFLPDGGRVIGGDGILGNLQYEFRNYGWMFPDGSDMKNGYWNLGYNTEFYSETGVWKNYIMADIEIPNNFTVTEAKIKLLHANVRWDNGSAQAWGYCRNLKAYKVTNSNNFEIYGAYASEYDDRLIWSKSEIPNVFGSNGFTAPEATSFNLIEVESSDISSALNKGNNKIIIQTSNAPGAFTNNPNVAITRFGPHTGYVYALINIKGYMKT